MKTSRWSIGVAVVAASMATVAGCSSSTDVNSIMRSINDSNGKRLANFYAMYQTRSRSFSGPVDQTAFEKFISATNPAELEAMGVNVADVDKLFFSERDGKPFIFRYGVKKPPVLGGHQAVLREAEGKGGTVLVFMTGPKVVEASAADVDSYMNGDHDELPQTQGGLPPKQ